MTAGLARFVEEVRVVVPVAGRAHEVERLPDGRILLAVRRMTGHGSGDVAVAGPRTRAHFKTASGLGHVVVVEFKTGRFAPLLGVPATTLTDRIVLLEDLWGPAGGDLARRLLGAATVPELLDRLADALAARAAQAPEPASARLARQAIRRIEGGEMRVERVAEDLGVSARHLRRAFTDHVGISPKEFARTVRLRRAVQRSAQTRDWGRIAAEAGYYDQAHLIADFRDLVGQTPGAYVERRHRPADPHVAPCGPGAPLPLPP